MKGAVGTIYPVVLCGGSGSRLWPMSRQMFPKQFLPLVGDRTMLQDALARVAGPTFGSPIVVANEEHRFIIAEQLRLEKVTAGAIILEPFGRNTAPAACAAALAAISIDPDALMLVMPSDHVIQDGVAFLSAINAAAVAARTGALVTFGISPTYPETGYGYIHAGLNLDDAKGVLKVDRFVEKPNKATAEAYLAEGGYYWNAGIFLFSAATLLAELERLRPDILAACRAALTSAKVHGDFIHLDADAFGNCPSESIDYAVMEHTDRAAVVPVSMGWNDVGAWPALWDLGERDGAGNVVHGDVMLHEARDCYVRSEEGVLTALVGVEDVVVVVTDDAVLVSSKSRAQDVKIIVDRLKSEARPQHLFHTIVYRPWGSFRSIDLGPRFQVKQITVNPGAKLSLQMHHHRAEHWIVVEGTAKVTRGDETVLLHENQSTYIPLGVVHRLENPGKLPLRVIEVQSGSYLGEDDIVRLEDSFGRF